MRKTLWAMPFVGVLVMATGVPGAYAAATRSETMPVQYFNGTQDTIFSASPNNTGGPSWAIGDCEQFGYVFIDRPTAGGPGTLRWASSLTTSRTSNFDQWHQKFIFRTASGAQLLSIGPIDGPQMRTTGQYYTQEISTPLWLTQTVFDHIKQVTWIGEC